MGQGTGPGVDMTGSGPSADSSPALLPYGRQSIGDDDIAAVVDVLRSDWLTCGPAVDRFEEALRARCGARHAVAVSNGTAALHLAMRAAGVGPGDRVLTSSNTFLASANAAEYVGATADFADIDPVTRCLSVETLRAAWKPDVKAVVAVDFAGYPCVTEEMADFIHRRGALVVEDACHSIGGMRDGHRIGGLPWVDMATFSFHPVKTLTTGEGGAILTNQPTWAESCRLNRSHGMVRGPADAGSAARPYTMEFPGYNYRITDIQCALGMSQLKKLDSFVARRREIVDRYNCAFGSLSRVSLPPATGSAVAGWHLYALQIDFEGLGKARTEVADSLRASGIGTQIHYYPVHLQPYYARRYGYAPGKCPVAEKWYEQTISLPLFPAMTDGDVQRVIDAVLKALAVRRERGSGFRTTFFL